MYQIFKNRSEAGQYLAARLMKYRERDDVVVLGLPRGGIPVAYEVAQALNAPLDVFFVRKLGVPGREELAMGAVSDRGIRVLNQDIVQRLGIPREQIDQITARESEVIAHRQKIYRDDRPPPQVQDRVVILVDDGLATGATMRAAVSALRQQQPQRIVAAVPVAALETCALLQREVDEIVCATTPEPFYGVGQWYEEFKQLSDEEVIGFLEANWARFAPAGQ